MNTEDMFNIIFWTLLASMLLTRGWFQLRVWRTGERVLPDRAAKQREGFWARAVEGLFSLLLVALNLMLRIPPEEEMMLQRFGDEYRAYMKRTGRLFPVY